MTDFIISAFADESAPDLSGQLAALRRNGLRMIELRNIDGRSVVDFSDEELQNLHRELASCGISVSAMGSPIGKIDIHEDFAPHFARFQRAVRAAEILETTRIRMFSFFIPQGEKPENVREEVLQRLEIMCRYAEDHGVRCCHENEKGIYGDTVERVLDLHKALGDRMDGVFDPANFVQCGVNPHKAYPELAPYVSYLHVKDALRDTGAVVPAGQGDGCLPEILDAYHCPGETRILTVEPHLFDFGGLAALQTEELKHKQTYATPEEAFDTAVAQLKKILTERGYRYE